MGCHALLQGIFLTQGSNLGLLHCILYYLSHQGSPRILEWVAYPFSRGSSQPRNGTGVSCISGRFFYQLSYYWATVSLLKEQQGREGQFPVPTRRMSTGHSSAPSSSHSQQLKAAPPSPTSTLPSYRPSDPTSLLCDLSLVSKNLVLTARVDIKFFFFFCFWPRLWLKMLFKIRLFKIIINSFILPNKIIGMLHLE